MFLLLFQDSNEAFNNLTDDMRRCAFDKACVANRPIKGLDLVGMHTSVGFQARTQKRDEEPSVPGDTGNAA